jgi:hypothetical protein
MVWLNFQVCLLMQALVPTFAIVMFFFLEYAGELHIIAFSHIIFGISKFIFQLLLISWRNICYTFSTVFIAMILVQETSS